jgi:hypothetical protein
MRRTQAGKENAESEIEVFELGKAFYHSWLCVSWVLEERVVTQHKCIRYIRILSGR